MGERRELVRKRSMIFKPRAFVGMSPEGIVPVCFADLAHYLCLAEGILPLSLVGDP